MFPMEERSLRGFLKGQVESGKDIIKPIGVRWKASISLGATLLTDDDSILGWRGRLRTQDVRR